MKTPQQLLEEESAKCAISESVKSEKLRIEIARTLEARVESAVSEGKLTKDGGIVQFFDTYTPIESPLDRIMVSMIKEYLERFGWECKYNPEAYPEGNHYGARWVEYNHKLIFKPLKK